MTAAARSQPPLPPVAAPRRFPVLSECTAPPGDEPCRRTECCYHLAHRGRWDHRVQPTRDCAIAVANEAPRTIDEVAAILGLSRERVRQIEVAALAKLQASAELRRHYDESE